MEEGLINIVVNIYFIILMFFIHINNLNKNNLNK